MRAFWTRPGLFSWLAEDAVARYLQFVTADGSAILVEVDEEEVPRGQGVMKAGLGQRLWDTVTEAQTVFDEALTRIIHQNTYAFLHAVREIPDPPTDVEVTLGLKVTGEVGNVVVSKLGGDVNFTVKMTWKQLDQRQAGNPTAEQHSS
jgi:hypothetical protein